MNNLFKKTPIWQLLTVYLLANVLNVLMVLPLKHYFGMTQAVSDEVLRGIMFVMVLLWFLFLMVRNKASMEVELKNLRHDLRPKEGATILIFNYSLSLVMIFALVLLISAMSGFMGDSSSSTSESGVLASYTSVLLNFIATSFIVPIVEEFMFRGVLFSRLHGKFNVKTAVMLSSILFGITHSPLSMIGAMVFGICMCAIYLRTNNIAVPIAIHMIYNLILSMIQSNGVLWGNTTTGGLANMELSTTVALGGVLVFGIVALICGVYLSRKYNFWNFKQYQNNETIMAD